MRDAIRTELLVLRAQSGEAEGMSGLVAEWQPRLWAFARALADDDESAWDLTQETWMAIVQQLDKLQDARRFQAWAFRIVRNKAADRLRRLIRERSLPSSFDAESEVSPETVHPVREAMATLPVEDRELLALHYLEDLRCEDVAAILGIPVGTVKSRLHKARQKLRAVLEQDHE